MLQVWNKSKSEIFFFFLLHSRMDSNYPHFTEQKSSEKHLNYCHTQAVPEQETEPRSAKSQPTAAVSRRSQAATDPRANTSHVQVATNGTRGARGDAGGCWDQWDHRTAGSTQDTTIHLPGFDRYAEVCC